MRSRVWGCKLVDCQHNFPYGSRGKCTINEFTCSTCFESTILSQTFDTVFEGHVERVGTYAAVFKLLHPFRCPACDEEIDRIEQECFGNSLSLNAELVVVKASEAINA